MRVRPRIALFAGAIALTVTTAVAVTPFAADAAESPVAATIDVRGTLVVAQADGPAGGSTSYAVELADGSLVRVRGRAHRSTDGSPSRGRSLARRPRRLRHCGSSTVAR